MRKLKLEATEIYHEDEVNYFREALKNKDPSEFLTQYVLEKRTNELNIHDDVLKEDADKFWK